MCLAKSFNYNPVQLELVMERTDALESYKRGYNTGVNWDASWMPGGPMQHKGKNAKLRDQSERDYNAWHEGFERGLKVRMENPYFTAWWNETRKSHKDKRYYMPEVLNEEMA